MFGLVVLDGCSAQRDVVSPALGHLPSSAIAVSQERAGALVSEYRRSHGLSGVVVDASLQRAAQAQADAMASADLLSHTVAGSLPARLAMVDASDRASVENVSAGYADLESALGGWRRSPAHNANLLYTPMRRLGIAAAEAPGTRYKTFWALVMTN